MLFFLKKKRLSAPKKTNREIQQSTQLNQNEKETSKSLLKRSEEEREAVQFTLAC